MSAAQPLPMARSLTVVMSPAQLLAEAEDLQARAAALAAAGLAGIRPAADRLAEDLAAFAGLTSAKVGPRDRARQLALHIAREMDAIEELQRAAP